MACGMEAKRQGGGGWNKRRMGEQRRDGGGEEERGHGLVYWIYLFNSRKKNIIHHLIFLLLHIGEAATRIRSAGRCQVKVGRRVLPDTA